MKTKRRERRPVSLRRYLSPRERATKIGNRSPARLIARPLFDATELQVANAFRYLEA